MIAALLCSVALASVSVSSVSGQEAAVMGEGDAESGCGACSDQKAYWDGYLIDAHAISINPFNPTGLWSCASDGPAHNFCHADPRPGTCAYMHRLCGEGGNLAIGELEHLADMTVVDIDAVTRALVKAPQLVAYNEAREALQIMNCTGGVIAQYQFSDEQWRVLSAAAVDKYETPAPSMDRPVLSAGFGA
jgi:hypothetical protein